MAHQALAMSSTANSARKSEFPALDAALDTLSSRKDTFAQLSIRQKIELLKQCQANVEAVALEWVSALCEVKGLPLDSPLAAEEWWSPYHVNRHFTLLIRSLSEIERDGKPSFGAGKVSTRNGRLRQSVVPLDVYDSLLFGILYGVSAEVVFQPGITEEQARASQAKFYQQSSPAGAVNLILGAGNVSSIPVMDVLTKMFNEGQVCLLKMNPVNEACGPALEKLLKPLIDQGFVRVVYGGGDVGAYLCQHDAVDEIHITGSEHTHDLIVWGPAGPERERRKADNDPVLTKRITSELGNVTPMIVVPARYTQAQLKAQANNVVMMLTNNASFNCIAGKMLVMSRQWPQRSAFVDIVRAMLKETTPRKAYYPGAQRRYEQLTDGRALERYGAANDDQLPWTLITDLDPNNTEDPLFQTEPFCAVLSMVELDAADPVSFMRSATEFCNETLWGQLGATVIVPPAIERHPSTGDALNTMLDELRYGSIGVNQWSAVNYSLCTTPWGSFPGNTLDDIGSGIGFVHNSCMFEGLEKGISRASIVPMSRPPWMPGHSLAHVAAQHCTQFETKRSLLALTKAAIAGLRG